MGGRSFAYCQYGEYDAGLSLSLSLSHTHTHSLSPTILDKYFNDVTITYGMMQMVLQWSSSILMVGNVSCESKQGENSKHWHVPNELHSNLTQQGGILLFGTLWNLKPFGMNIGNKTHCVYACAAMRTKSTFTSSTSKSSVGLSSERNNWHIIHCPIKSVKMLSIFRHWLVCLVDQSVYVWEHRNYFRAKHLENVHTSHQSIEFTERESR